MLGCLFGGRRDAERISERRGWQGLAAEEKFIHCCAWIAVRWWNSARRVKLTCIHKMCRHSCPGTPRLGGGPLSLLLLTKWREDISDFHKRRQLMKITVSPDCYIVECQSLIPCTYSMNERSVQALEKIAKCQIKVSRKVLYISVSYF